MNDSDLLIPQRSLPDMINLAGDFGLPLALVTLGLIIFGTVLIVRRSSAGIRQAYAVASLLPLFFGASGTARAVSMAWPSLSAHMGVDKAGFLSAVEGVTLPLALGMLGSAIAMTLACLMWTRQKRPVNV